MFFAASADRHIIKCHGRDPVTFIINVNHKLSEISHIYPFSTKHTTTLPEIQEFWQALRIFRTGERLATWWKAIYEDGQPGPEKLQNLLCLDPGIHLLHGLGWFGFEPLNAAPDGSWMNVQFWWLLPGERDAPVELTTFPQLPQILDPIKYRVIIHDARPGRHVCSGNVKTFVTQNPRTHQLPDMRVMEMIWFLNVSLR